MASRAHKPISERKLAANRANGKLGGKPKGSLNKATIARALLVESFKEKVAAHLTELLALSMANARGLMVCESVDPETGSPVGVYKAKPDQRAIDSLLSRIVPDPPKEVKVDGELDRTVTVIHEYTK